MGLPILTIGMFDLVDIVVMVLVAMGAAEVEVIIVLDLGGMIAIVVANKG